MDDHAADADQVGKQHNSGFSPGGEGLEGEEGFADDAERSADIRASVSRMATAFVHQAEDAVNAQQSMIAAVMRDVAKSLRNPDRSEFRADTQRFLGGDGEATPILVSAFADALETSAAHVEAFDVNRVTGEATRFVRQQPLAAAGVAVIAGLALARFARSASR